MTKLTGHTITDFIFITANQFGNFFSFIWELFEM